MEEARATFLGHVAELRRRLLWVVATFASVTVVAFLIRVEPAAPFVGLDPYDNLAAQMFRAAAEHLVPAGTTLVVTGPMDAFNVQLAWSFALAVMVSIPVAFYHVGRFLSPALRPRESRVLRNAVLPIVMLFLAGAAFAYLFVLPLALRALYGFSGALGAAPLLDVGEFSGFLLATLVGFGVAFETPVVMVTLARAGLVEPRTYWRYWRHAAVAALVVGMVLTPDPTIVSQLLLAAPLLLLYVAGAALSRSPAVA